ncbi:MAG TPA: peptidylprolyl isomerase [Longimicrobiales bacterium]|nr:peptidylprolyl isomerase [Longimicrobiales bacterium]
MPDASNPSAARALAARRTRLAPLLLSLVGAAVLGGCVSVAAPPPLTDPADARFQVPAPDRVRVRFETSRGPFVVELERELAPHGVDRLYNLVRAGFYDGARFFRVVDRFVAQFGLSGDPAVTAAWREATIPDDPVVASNRRGSLTFATSGPNARTTQLFINLADNTRLDRMGFAPLGRVVEGMEVVDRLFAGYGEGAPMGRGPDQQRIMREGDAYLEREFPSLDHIVRAELVEP